METTLRDSYRYCRRIARQRARNFYYAFLLLPKPKRDAMCAIYAFMRYCDDLSDDPGASAAAIERWRVNLEAALGGYYSDHPVWPAFHEAVDRYRIPDRYFVEIIEGVSSDIEPRKIQTFDELYRYCYHVASVVGLTVIHVFGFESPDALALAEKCGIAFQLTNILRDVREDAGRKRIYLPAEDLTRFGVNAHDLLAGKRTEGFVELMRFEAARARTYYMESMPLVGMINPRCRSSMWALIRIYSRLLDRIVASDFDIFARRISVPAWEKCAIIARAALGRPTGDEKP
jgi:phytoene synthase